MLEEQKNKDILNCSFNETNLVEYIQVLKREQKSTDEFLEYSKEFWGEMYEQ